MIYLDTNLVINSLIDNPKKELSKDIFYLASAEKNLITSHLLIQEVSYVLFRNKVEKSEINEAVRFLLNFIPYYKNNVIFERALEIANLFSFKDINDYIHLSFAEQFCSELITFDKGFKKLSEYTKIKISVL